MTTYPLRYTWRNDEKRATLTGRRCRVVKGLVASSNGKMENGAEFCQLRFMSFSTHCCNRNLPVAYLRPRLCF